jgi:hypothetical protein
MENTHHSGGHEAQESHRAVGVEVNTKHVRLHGHEATGLQIKEAAIAQGVNIHVNFVLEQELANGSSKVIGDSDPVKLHEHLRFTAIAPDDNS